MLTYIATEPRHRRNFWTLERRAKRAALEALSAGPVSPFMVVLSTGEQFLVTHDGKEVRVERQGGKSHAERTPFGTFMMTVVTCTAT